MSGIVVAKTHPGNATCVACLDEKTFKLIRPTPSQGGPFWTDPGVASLAVGCRVHWQATGCLSRALNPFFLRERLFRFCRLDWFIQK